MLMWKKIVNKYAVQIDGFEPVKRKIYTDKLVINVISVRNCR